MLNTSIKIIFRIFYLASIAIAAVSIFGYIGRIREGIPENGYPYRVVLYLFLYVAFILSVFVNSRIRPLYIIVSSLIISIVITFGVYEIWSSAGHPSNLSQLMANAFLSDILFSVALAGLYASNIIGAYIILSQRRKNLRN
ncbi:hypothetical protein GCM10023115_24230 [Pontixanthobacter gangjinensis]